MINKRNPWTKDELKIYILLLCAKADAIENPEEIRLIKSKTNLETFDRLYKEINEDDEDTRFTKIEESVAKLTFSHMELATLKTEIREVVSADGKFHRAERYLSRILDNIVY